MVEFPVEVATVYDSFVADILRLEGYCFLQHEDGGPYRFIGVQAQQRAQYWQRHLDEPVGVDFTLREAYVVQLLLRNEGFNEVADKILNAIKSSED